MLEAGPAVSAGLVLCTSNRPAAAAPNPGRMGEGARGQGASEKGLKGAAPGCLATECALTFSCAIFMQFQHECVGARRCWRLRCGL